MKIGRAIRILITIVVIIAMIATLALMEVLGFVVSLMIIFYSLMYIIGAIFMLYSAYENIKAKEIVSAVGNVLIVVILLFAGVKMLKWLISVLM